MVKMVNTSHVSRWIGMMIGTLALAGCASGELPGISESTYKESQELERQSSHAADQEGDFQKAIALRKQAIDKFTDGGKLSQGQGSSYLVEALNNSIIGQC